jgi:uncharacterized membrane protein YeiH
MFYLIDLFGTAVFAVSGAIVASRKEMDIFGVLVLAVVTATGGGTLRDLLLGIEPVFWIADPTYLLVASLAALLRVFVGPLPFARQQTLVVSDAIGLAFFCVLGAYKGLQAGAPVGIPVILGMMTGVFGGILRDVLAGEVPLIFRRDLYATCAAAGAGVFELSWRLGWDPVVGGWIAMAVALFLRLGAIRWHWGLPAVPLRGSSDG